MTETSTASSYLGFTKGDKLGDKASGSQERIMQAKGDHCVNRLALVESKGKRDFKVGD